MVEFVYMFVIKFFLKKEDTIFQELQNIKCLWVEISIKNKIHLIGTFYRPPPPPPRTQQMQSYLQ